MAEGQGDEFDEYGTIKHQEHARHFHLLARAQPGIYGFRVRSSHQMSFGGSVVPSIICRRRPVSGCAIGVIAAAISAPPRPTSCSPKRCGPIWSTSTLA